MQRKQQKGKAAEQIAEELEEPVENIVRICKILEECGPDADISKIYERAYGVR